MKNTAFRFALPFAKIQKHHIQFFLMVLAIVMLVLGAGAPVDVGGIGIK